MVVSPEAAAEAEDVPSRMFPFAEYHSRTPDWLLASPEMWIVNLGGANAPG